jgi:hypothetical protein
VVELGELYVPFGHWIQDDLPEPIPYVPSGQLKQDHKPEKEYEPIGHWRQLEAPNVELYVPAEQSTQLEEIPMLNFPEEQNVQVDAPWLETDPSGQEEQTDCPVKEKKPMLQFEHDDWLARSVNLPLVHSEHVENPASEKVDAWHGKQEDRPQVFAYEPFW